MRYPTILISTFTALSLSLTINQTVHTEEIGTQQIGQKPNGPMSIELLAKMNFLPSIQVSQN